MDQQGTGEADVLTRFEPALRARARRMIGVRLLRVVGPSDLLQETNLIAVRRFAELAGRPPREVLAWLLRTMQFRLMRHVRDHRAELAGKATGPGVEDLSAPSSAVALDRIVREEVREVLARRIDALPDPERVALVQIYQERRTTADVALELGRTEGAVRALHQRAVRRLREQLGDFSDGC